MTPAPMTKRTLRYWLWRFAFEWRVNVSRKIARHYNRASQRRGVAR